LAAKLPEGYSIFSFIIVIHYFTTEPQGWAEEALSLGVYIPQETNPVEVIYFSSKTAIVTGFCPFPFYSSSEFTILQASWFIMQQKPLACHCLKVFSENSPS